MSKILFLCVLFAAATTLVFGDEFIRWVLSHMNCIVYFCILFVFVILICIKIIRSIAIHHRFGISFHCKLTRFVSLKFGFNSIIHSNIFCIFFSLWSPCYRIYCYCVMCAFFCFLLLPNSVVYGFQWKTVSFFLNKKPSKRRIFYKWLWTFAKRIQFIDKIFVSVDILFESSLSVVFCVQFVRKLFWPHWPYYQVKIQFIAWYIYLVILKCIFDYRYLY